MLDLRHLATFRVVATTLSFTQTAVLLGYAQSSITMHIQSLEETLGVPLFHRLGRRVQLTEAGQRLLPYAERLLDLASETERIVSHNNTMTGSLLIGAPETICTYLLPRILRAFRDAYPQVQLSFQPLLDVALYDQSHQGILDVAFLLQRPIQSNHLHVEILSPMPLYVVCASDHPLAQRIAVTPTDLRGETILLTERGCGYRHLFEQSLAGHPLVKLEFTSIEAIKQCVLAGLGVAALPAMAIAAEVARGELCRLNWPDELTIAIQMVWHKNKWLSPTREAFLALCREMAGQALHQQVG